MARKTLRAAEASDGRESDPTEPEIAGSLAIAKVPDSDDPPEDTEATPPPVPSLAGRSAPAYELIARDLRNAILNETYPKGSPLPTEAQLSDTYGVSRQTVRRAFQDLVAERVVQRIPGRGTFPMQSRSYTREFGSLADLIGITQDAKVEVVTPLRRGVNIEAAGRLRLDRDVVYYSSFIRSYDDAPYCFNEVFINPSIGVLIENKIREAEKQEGKSFTIVGLIDEQMPDLVVEVDESVTVALADENLASLLHCEVGRPLLKADRSYLTQDGEYAELAVNYFLPELYSYRVRVRRNPGLRA